MWYVDVMIQNVKPRSRTRGLQGGSLNHAFDRSRQIQRVG